MPYDDLPNNGWGDPPKYDWTNILVWGGMLFACIFFWGLFGYLLWYRITS